MHAKPRPCLQAWVSPDSGVPDPAAIVRVFGDKSELFIDRDRDLQVGSECPKLRQGVACAVGSSTVVSTPVVTVLCSRRRLLLSQVLLQMNAQNFGPRLLGTFANGPRSDSATATARSSSLGSAWWWSVFRVAALSRHSCFLLLQAASRSSSTRAR